MDNIDDIALCCICTEEYDDDPDKIVDKTKSHLPVQSAKCQHRICYSCLMAIKMNKAAEEEKDPCDVKWLKCPPCGDRKTCFNSEDPVIDRGRCEALKLIRRLTNRGTISSAAASSSAGVNSARDDSIDGKVSTSNAISLETSMQNMKAVSPKKGHGCHTDQRPGAKQHYDSNESDEESRFSDTSGLDLNANNNETAASNAPLPQSSLISREQLHCLTGGVRGGHKNPLNVGTPMGFCGGRSLATLNGNVHHICIKECMNHPLPTHVNKQFLLYRRTKGRGSLVRDIQLLIDTPNHPPIPIFWEPADQVGTRVTYVGHWKVTDIEDYSNKPVLYMGIQRCALLRLKFDHFDQGWAQIIYVSHDKTNDEIRAINWDEVGLEEDGLCSASNEAIVTESRNEGNLKDNLHSKTIHVRRKKRKR